MKKSMLLTGVTLVAGLALSEVKMGENLILNGLLEADQSVLPSFWVSQDADAFIVHNGGGPDGKPYVSLNTEGEAREMTLRQFGLKLAARGKFRISAMVRTKGFSCSRHVLGVANAGWRADRGIGSIPADTDGKWVRLENVFDGFVSKVASDPSRDGVYSFVVYVKHPKGQLDFADLSISVADEVASRETEVSGMSKFQSSPRLLPVEPLLWNIPSDDLAVTFQLYGKLPSGNPGDYDAVLRTGWTSGGRPLPADGKVRMGLPQGATQGVFTVALVRRSDGQEVFSEQRTYRVRNLPRNISTAGHRRLNNFVTEVLSRPLAAGENRHSFTTVRDGWIFVLAWTRQKYPELRVRVDGREVIDAATPGGETFRYVGAGEHTVEVSGVEQGTIVVRSVAEMFNYCPNMNSKVKENPHYDWAYQKKYCLRAVTTEDGSSLPPDAAAELHGSGRIHLANVNTGKRKAEAIYRQIEQSAGMKSPSFDGVSCDEENFPEPEDLYEYSTALKAYELKYRPERRIYTWAIGRPGTTALDMDFILTCINASQGRGKVMMESYLRTQDTEEDARNMVEIAVIDRIRLFRKLNPMIVPSIGMTLGNFNQVPILSLTHHPEVDYKYYLDLQLNMVANSPDCRDLGTVGYWGSYYADDELHRWSFALMRHYAVDGKTNMLSKTYGYRYHPDLILNGDFRKTLAPWQAAGDVKLDSCKGVGDTSECRWTARGGLGDTFAALNRTADRVASVRQIAKGLVPGRMYCLQFATFDVDDMKAGRHRPRRYGIDARISDAAVDEELSWCHIDWRKNDDGEKGEIGRINLRHVVFTAKAVESEIVIDNAGAKAGETLGVNYVSLNPYYPPERAQMTTGVTDIGSRRELFCHPVLIDAARTTATRTLHHPEPAGVVMTQDAPWEGNSGSYGTVFRDGDIYRLYYMAFNFNMDRKKAEPPKEERHVRICYAESRDGFNWTRPNLGRRQWRGSTANNILFDWTDYEDLDNITVFMDTNPSCNPDERYKAIVQYYTPVKEGNGRATALWLFAGQTATDLRPLREIIRRDNWSRAMQEGGILIDTQSTAHWDPRRKLYHLYTRGYHRAYHDRNGDTHIRDIRHATSPDCCNWSSFELLDFGPDAEDYPLYTNVIGPYERAPHILVGFPTRYVERPAWSDSFDRLPGIDARKIKMKSNPRFGLTVTDTIFMCSRDGQRFERYDEAFMPPGPQANHNWIYGDGYLYCGRLVTPGRYGKDPELSFYHFSRDYKEGKTNIERYCLRMDGFVSYFGTYLPQKLVTRPIRYTGRKMLLNVATSARGYVRVRIRECGTNDEIVSSEIFGDEIDREVGFAKGEVARMAGKPVTIEFELSDAHVYACKFE